MSFRYLLELLNSASSTRKSHVDTMYVDTLTSTCCLFCLEASEISFENHNKLSYFFFASKFMVQDLWRWPPTVSLGVVKVQNALGLGLRNYIA